MASNSESISARAALVARAGLRRFLSLAAAGVCLLVLAPIASADKAISQPGEAAGQTNRPQGLATDFETGRLYVADHGNNRVDVFESDGSFAFAFGWGVADGEAQLQSCGPGASPPTPGCQKGLSGFGAGEFDANGLKDIAVDNDPTSPSYHDVYALERDADSRAQEGHSYRVQKFDPEGNFLLTFGGGVIGGGASGTGNLTAGSKEVTSVITVSKTFELGQEIESPGRLLAGTKIVGVGNGTIALSKPAIASGVAAPLSVAEGLGNVPTNETYTVVNKKTLSEGTKFHEMNLRFTTPPPSPSELETETTIPREADGAELQAGLEALPNIGPGNVKVTGESIGPEKHEFTLEFSGTRFADTNVLFGGGLGQPPDVTLVQQGASSPEICTAGIAKSCGSGIQGSGHGQFYQEAHLALGPGGVVYVADCVRVQAGESGPCQNRLQEFELSGAFVEQIALPQKSGAPEGIAVDSSGDFSVSYNNAVLEYDPSGSVIDELPVAHEAGALAVDLSGGLFAAETDGANPKELFRPVITEYDSSGNTLRRFGYDTIVTRPSGLAPVLGSEAVYSSEGDSVMLRDFPSAGPLIRLKPCSTSFLGNAKATLLAEVNPEGKATSAHFQYVDQKHFEEEGGFASPNTKTSAVEALGSDVFLHRAHGEASLEPETEYRCRVIATDSESHTVIGQEGAFTTKKPLELGATTVSEVGTEEATLNAEVNPLGIAGTTGFFEYVEETAYLKDIKELGPEHGFDHATKVPNVDGEAEEPIDFGAGESLKVGSAHISGLKPGTSYRFRIVAEDPFPTGHAIGPATRFRTFSPGEGGLPESRAWEMVSPPDKNGGDVVATPNTRGVIESNSLQIQAGAASGESVTYTSWTSFGEAQGGPGTSQYLSKRTSDGWQTENVSPPGFQAKLEVPPYLGFSPDLGFGAVKAGEVSLASGCPVDRENLYLHEADTGALRCLTPEAPNTAGKFGYCFVYGGSSEDGARVFFKAQVPYANAPAGNGASLYEWHEGKLNVVSVLPGQGEPTAPTPSTSFGAYSAEGCQTGQSILRHAISADGTKAIWTYVPSDKTKPSQLLDRVNGTETVQLDAVQSGNASKPGNGLFWAASKDGSVVYFTDENKLISQVKAEAGAPDLYRYDFSKPIGQRLTDLTKGSVPGSAQGVLGASDDGSKVYYVAKAALTPEAEENEAGQHSEAGKNNLYLYDATEAETKFVARLSGEDNLDWETQPKNFTARVAPDGRHLAFLSIESQKLAGYDNTLAAKSGKFASGTHCWIDRLTGGLGGGPLCPQAFVYDAQSGKLACVSCNPSGARPIGPTILPGWTNVYEGPRILSDNGGRLFFESFDRLSDADQNLRRDVYEFELEGEGDCTSESPAFDPSSAGCHSLISSGRSEDESYLLDASSNGRDVFFSTRSPLVGWDIDDSYDVYDARAGGGFPEPPPIEEPCRDEACKLPATSAPSGSSPSTPRFQSSGNVSEAAKPRCPKGKRAVRGRSGKPRCVKQHQGKKHHQRGGRQ